MGSTNLKNPMSMDAIGSQFSAYTSAYGPERRPITRAFGCVGGMLKEIYCCGGLNDSNKNAYTPNRSVNVLNRNANVLSNSQPIYEIKALTLKPL
jgi:hypothetical protein